MWGKVGVGAGRVRGRARALGSRRAAAVAALGRRGSRSAGRGGPAGESGRGRMSRTGRPRRCELGALTGPGAGARDVSVSGDRGAFFGGVVVRGGGGTTAGRARRRDGGRIGPLRLGSSPDPGPVGARTGAGARSRAERGGAGRAAPGRGRGGPRGKWRKRWGLGPMGRLLA